MKRKVLSLMLVFVLIGIFTTSAFAETLGPYTSSGAPGQFVSNTHYLTVNSSISITYECQNVTFAQAFLYKDGVAVGSSKYAAGVNGYSFGWSNLAPGEYKLLFNYLYNSTSAPKTMAYTIQTN